MNLASSFQESPKDTPDLAVVLTIFHESERLEATIRELREVFLVLGVSWEIIAVDDGSTDDSPRVVGTLHIEDMRERMIEFRSNFGQSAAIEMESTGISATFLRAAVLAGQHFFEVRHCIDGQRC